MDMLSHDEFYREAFARNIGLLTEDEQVRLRGATIAIAGLGGVGGIHATTLIRLGIERFHLADMDNFEVVNINRQAGATMETMGRPKTTGLKNLLLDINPHAEITLFESGVTEETVDAFLDGVDAVIDGIDFFDIETRRLLYRQAAKRGLFVFSAGPIGFGSSLLVFDPQGMTFDDYFDLHDGQNEIDMLTRFGLGLTPTLMQRSYFRPDAVDWHEKKAPSLVIGTLLAANLVACEIVKLLLGKPVVTVPSSMHFDPYLRQLKKVTIPWGNKNPWQRLKLFLATRILRRRTTKRAE